MMETRLVNLTDKIAESYRLQLSHIFSLPVNRASATSTGLCMKLRGVIQP